MEHYDPHKNVSITDEEEVMSKGRLVKVRFPDQPPPNVDWFWIPTGNCHACKFYQRLDAGAYPDCLNQKITTADFFDKYMATNDCPEFEHGYDKGSVVLDVMKAVKLVSGKPAQRVTVIRDEPWSMDLSLRAHREASEFLNMAHDAQYFSTHPGSNNPNHWDYVDLSDDLERPEPAPMTAEEEDAQNAAALGNLSPPTPP